MLLTVRTCEIAVGASNSMMLVEMDEHGLSAPEGVLQGYVNISPCCFHASQSSEGKTDLFHAAGEATIDLAIVRDDVILLSSLSGNSARIFE